MKSYSEQVTISSPLCNWQFNTHFLPLPGPGLSGPQDRSYSQTTCRWKN